MSENKSKNTKCVSHDYGLIFLEVNEKTINSIFAHVLYTDWYLKNIMKMYKNGNE